MGKRDVTIEYCNADACHKSRWHKIMKSGELECMVCGMIKRPPMDSTRGKGKKEKKPNQRYDV